MNQQKRSKQFGLILALLIVVWCSGAAAQNDLADSPIARFGTEISIAPEADAPRIWQCEAILKDLASGQVLSAPAIAFAAGEEASVQSGLSANMVWELRVEVSVNASVARWSSRVTLGEQVLSESTGVLRTSVK